MKRSMKFGALALLLAGGCVDSNPEQLAPSPSAAPFRPSTQARAIGTVTTSEETGWTQAGHLGAPLLQHTATRLQDGRVLVAGGYTQRAELFNPATGTWAPTGNAPASYRGATATLLPSGKVLVTGANSNGISASLYDPASGTWTATGSLAAPRYHHTALLLANGQVLVTGGTASESGTTPLGSAELYDPATGTWTATGSLVGARHHHTATLLPNGQVLVAGGGNASGRLSSAELFTPATGTWTSVSALGTARSSHTATLLANGLVLVTGGALDGEPSTRAELFNPATGTWTATGPLLHPRRNHTATLLANGRVLVTGGYDDSAGIQTAAELYDPARGVWDALPSMGVSRYQHTATLLANGRVLVAGGFSTGDQTSSEVFSATYVEVTLGTGTGWELMNISGANTDNSELPAFDSNVYVVGDDTGIAHAPMPGALRTKLAASSANRSTVFILDKKILDEIHLSEQQGTLTPYLQSIATPAETTLLAEDDSCPDEALEPKQKTWDFTKYLTATKDLGDGLSGTIKTSGNLEAKATLTANVNKVRARILAWCVPAGFDLQQVTVDAKGALNYGASVEGSISSTNGWAFPIAKPHLGSIAFLAGPIPVYIGVNLPLTMGLDLKTTVTGQISYTANQSMGVNYKATCTFDGCTDESSVTAPTSSGTDVAGSIQGRIEPSVWAQAAVRAYLYSEHAAYAQVGVRPYVDGDLWGYVGYNCGDADGDTQEEFVRGSYFDLNWRVNVTAEVSGLSIFTKEWTNLWSTGKQHIYFKNLAPTVPGGWTPFDPMMVGSANPGQYDNTAYSIRMRPCFPFQGENAINYEVNWGDGAAESFSGAKFDTVALKRHAWQQEGLKTASVKAVSDSHGRTFNSTYQRTIDVFHQQNPTVPPEYFRQVNVDGQIDLKEDDGTNKYATIWVNDVAYLDPSNPTATFHYSQCVEDEVRGEVDVVLTLLADNVTVQAKATGKLFEGNTDCNTDDLEGEKSAEGAVARDGSHPLQFRIDNTEWLSTDYLSLNLTVTNNPQQP